LAQITKTQSPNPNPQSPLNQKILKNKMFN